MDQRRSEDGRLERQTGVSKGRDGLKAAGRETGKEEDQWWGNAAVEELVSWQTRKGQRHGV